jgi:hypothetical protein
LSALKASLKTVRSAVDRLLIVTLSADPHAHILGHAALSVQGTIEHVNARYASAGRAIGLPHTLAPMAARLPTWLRAKTRRLLLYKPAARGRESRPLVKPQLTCDADGLRIWER